MPAIGELRDFCRPSLRHARRMVASIGSGQFACHDSNLLVRVNLPFILISRPIREAISIQLRIAYTMTLTSYEDHDW